MQSDVPDELSLRCAELLHYQAARDRLVSDRQDDDEHTVVVTRVGSGTIHGNWQVNRAVVGTDGPFLLEELLRAGLPRASKGSSHRDPVAVGLNSDIVRLHPGKRRGDHDAVNFSIDVNRKPLSSHLSHLPRCELFWPQRIHPVSARGTVSPRARQ